MDYAPSTAVKQGKARFLLIAYVIIVAVVWNICCMIYMLTFIPEFVRVAQGHAPGAPAFMIPPWPIIGLVPFVMPCVFWTASLLLFPARYSAFGPLLRTPMPSGPPIASSAFSAGRIGFFGGTAPFFSWQLFADGIGLTFHPGARAFVPFAAITSIQDGSMGGKRIVHTWPEVRGPIHIPAGAVADGVQAAQRVHVQRGSDRRP
jgi:hypothetical protein